MNIAAGSNETDFTHWYPELTRSPSNCNTLHKVHYRHYRSPYLPICSNECSLETLTKRENALIYNRTICTGQHYLLTLYHSTKLCVVSNNDRECLQHVSSIKNANHTNREIFKNLWAPKRPDKIIIITDIVKMHHSIADPTHTANTQ